MGDVEKLLLKALKTAVLELSNNQIGNFDTTDEDGIHYLFAGEEYIISVKKANSEESQSTKNLEKRVSNLLREIGIPASIKGYYFIRDAIVLSVDDESIIRYGNVTKVLYPTLANKHKTTISKIERAIRHAVEVAWTRGNVDMLDALFGYTVNVDKGKPANSEFIALVADHIRINKVGV